MGVSKGIRTIVQLATLSSDGQSYAKDTPIRNQAPVVTEPNDSKTLAQLQKEYDDEVATTKAAQAAAASSSGDTSSPGFSTWSQEYNFQNYILPNIW